MKCKRGKVCPKQPGNAPPIPAGAKLCDGCDDQPTVSMFSYDGMFWTRCKMRKTMRGYNGGIVRAGRWGYRPLTNGKDRMLRLGDVPKFAMLYPQNDKLKEYLKARLTAEGWHRRQLNAAGQTPADHKETP